MKTVIYAGLLVLIAFAAPGCVMVTASAQAEGSFDRTLNVSGPVSLDVSTGSGTIAIHRGAGDRVQVHGRIRAGANWFGSSRDAEEAVRQLEANPPIEQAGQTIRIGRIANRDWARDVAISYEIVAPAQSNVTSHTGSGGQTLESLAGRVVVGTGSGRITLRDITGDLDANTGSGSIDATGFRGGLRLRTGSGGVRVQGEQSGRWDLQTGSGPIDVDLPSNASFELSAHTGSGAVEVGYPLTMRGRGDRHRHDVSGTVGSGGQVLSAHTGSGHIRIQ
jgi:hypothetical protein